MRQPRLTFPGAYHHCTNRGHDGDPILAGSAAKQAFMDFLGENAVRYRLSIFAWCLMDNHYHLVLQNDSGRLSPFFRYLGAQFAVWYRTQTGGRGYVFQDRFHSTLIQDEEYLKLAVLYTLRNPVQAGLANGFKEYKWSSARHYFSGNAPAWLDAHRVEKLFSTPVRMDELVQHGMNSALPVLRTRAGPALGDESFQEKLNADAKKVARGQESKRHGAFEPAHIVIRNYEQASGTKISEIDLTTHAGKRLRSRLLMELKDKAGMTFAEIWKMPLFSDLNYRSLPYLCQRARKEKY